MTKKKKAISFPSKDPVFDTAFKSLMAHLAIPDPDSSTPLINSYTRLGIPIAIYNMLLALLGTATTVNTWLRQAAMQRIKPDPAAAGERPISKTKDTTPYLPYSAGPHFLCGAWRVLLSGSQCK